MADQDEHGMTEEELDALFRQHDRDAEAALDMLRQDAKSSEPIDLDGPRR